jgi:hypothetical protein
MAAVHLRSIGGLCQKWRWLPNHVPLTPLPLYGKNRQRPAASTTAHMIVMMYIGAHLYRGSPAHTACHVVRAMCMSHSRCCISRHALECITV